MSSGDASDALGNVVEYVREKLAPDPDRESEARASAHWLDDVNDGFDAIWCAVARLELIVHCGMTPDEVGGPVLVECKNKDALANELKAGCPDHRKDNKILKRLLVKKPPPGAPPWGN